MRANFWDKKIPTLLGLLIIIVGIGLTSFLVNKGAPFVIKAGPGNEPQNIRITNVSHSSFTVTYVTSDQVFGSVAYGTTSSFGLTALDDRDSLSRAVVPHKVHSITVNNLQPLTTYYFAINSAENRYLNNGQPFSIKTAPQLKDNENPQIPAAGKVQMLNASIPNEALVYLSSDNSQLISTVVKNDGTYTLPLNSLRTKDFSNYFTIQSSTVLKIIALGDGMSSNVSISASQISPIPTITLSNNYDFTSTPISSDSARTSSSSGFPSFELEGETAFTPTIMIPTEDQAFSDEQPNFTGKALPNETVEIEIHSDEQIKQTIKADSTGNWQFRPSEPLSPGDHTITIRTRSADGIIKTITKNFTVYAEGTQIADTSTTKATTSTTPTPTPSKAPTPTPRVSQSPTPTPTKTPTPTATPTPVIVTPTPIITPLPSIITSTPTPIAYVPSPVTTLPAAGNEQVLGIGILGVGVVIIGGLLFILTRGQIPL